MNNQSSTVGLTKLSDSLRRMKTLLAWHDLKESERRLGEPPALLMDTDLAVQIRNEQSVFMSTASEILESLNEQEKCRLPKESRDRWREQVIYLEAEFQRLNLPKTF